jgi:regulatory protein SWI5
MDMMDVGSAIASAMDLNQQEIGLTSSRGTSSGKTLSPTAISSAFMPTSSNFEDNNKYDLTSVSPEQITATSPSTMSNYSFHGLPTLPANPTRAGADTAPGSPAKSVTSNYTHNQPGTPPELSASSSPPPTNNEAGAGAAAQPPRYFDLDDVDDFDPNASGLSDHSIGLGTTVAAHAAAVSCGGGGGAGNMSGLSLVDVHDDMLLHAFGSHEDGLVQLHQAERDMMMGGGKYFEDVDEVALFTNAEDVDVFFGSS